MSGIEWTLREENGKAGKEYIVIDRLVKDDGSTGHWSDIARVKDKATGELIVRALTEHEERYQATKGTK